MPPATPISRLSVGLPHLLFLCPKCWRAVEHRSLSEGAEAENRASATHQQARHQKALAPDYFAIASIGLQY